MPLNGARSILEVGGGRGMLAEQVLRRRPPGGAEYVVTEIDEYMTECLKLRLQRFEKVQVIRTSEDSSYPFPDGRFDMIISTYVLDSLTAEMIESHVAEMARVTVRGGLVLVLSLSHGTTLLSRVTDGVWRSIYRINPAFVGRSRPISLVNFFRPPIWSVRSRQAILSRGFCSELVVAQLC